MTSWDNIYQEYERGGEAWATLGEEILPQFKNFVDAAQFTRKTALDIGAGTGKYIAYLEQKGFEVHGIDFSPTSVKMIRQALPSALVEQADMFEYQIPGSTFDLIVSIATIHHGTKQQVQELVSQFFTALLPGGKIFVTLPILGIGSPNEEGKKIALGTFVPLDGPEKGLPHSLFTKQEVIALFSKFSTVSIEPDDIGRWLITGKKDQN